MSKMLGQRLLVCACLLSGAHASVSTAQVGPGGGSPGANPVVEWNQILLTIVRTPGVQPATVHPTRSFAIMHAAIYDAVNAIDGRFAPYAVAPRGVPTNASQPAAAATAAHDVLVALYPSLTASLDARLAESLSSIPDNAAKTAGIEVGRDVAARMLALRRNDESAAPPVPYTFGDRAGDYQSTPPNFPQPAFTHWRYVDPFVLQNEDRFHLNGPPPLETQRYGEALEEVKAAGVTNGARSTADEAVTGRFWNGPIQNYWNEIAQTVSRSQNLSLSDTARLFALLDLTIADCVITFYDAKYTYNFWRPVTAVRAAANDTNAATAADPNWLPQSGNSPADPSYPGAHAVVASASATVLKAFFNGDDVAFDVTSETLPGVTRSFNQFSAAMREASLSRIFAGVHYRFDEDDGEQLGSDVAKLAIARLFHERRNDRVPRGLGPRRE